MTDNDLVGDLNSEGAGGNQPQVSQEGGKPIASTAVESQDFVSKKEFDVFAKELRGLQSRQDKAQSEQARFMEDLRTHMAKGLSLDEAEKAVNEQNKAREKDDLLYRMAEKLGVSQSPSQPPAAGNGGTVTMDAANVIKQYQLDPGDPEVANMLRGEYKSQIELENAALKLVYQRSRPNSPSPSAASALVGTPAQNNSGETLSRLQTLQKDPIRNRVEIAKLEKELGW